MKKVVIIQRTLKTYRIPFYQKLKEKCTQDNIELIIIYGKDDVLTFNDADLEWGISINNIKYNVLGHHLYYQPISKYIKGADLIIVEQASKLIINYYLWLLNLLGIKKLAFWGHGKNFQAKNKNSISEKIKRVMSKHVYWWFAYNDLSAKIVESFGYPKERITIVNNSIDTNYLDKKAKSINKERLTIIKKQHNIEGNKICLFVGGMYKEKRLPFLLEACLLIKKEVSDFEMIFIGAGDEQFIIEEATKKHKWIHYLGAKFGDELIPYFKFSKLLLMPGLVGLVILDSFSLLTPLVTTNVNYHSPEISYLVNDINGIMVDSTDDPVVYADKVIELLNDEDKRQKLIEGCKIAREQYTIENMVDNFCDGLRKALVI
jgi:glycosyltransferase involved in cell wall biosynthesis